MSDMATSTALLHTHHLSRQIGHVNKQIKSLQVFEESLGGRLKELERSVEVNNIQDVQQTIAALERRVQQNSDHCVQTEVKLTFLQQSLQETLNQNKSLQRRLEQLQAAYDAVIDAVERMQPGQDGTDGNGLTFKLNSVQDAQNHNREQMDAVHHRMMFLEEENVQVKRTVAQLTAKLQIGNCNVIKAPGVVKATPEMTFSSPVSLRSSPLQCRQDKRVTAIGIWQEKVNGRDSAALQPGREVPIRQAQLKLPAKGRSVEKPVGEQKLPSDLGYLPTILRSGRKITRNVEDPLAKKLYQATQRPSTLGDGTILTQKIPTSGRSLGPRGRNQTQVLRCSQRLITKKAKSNAQVGLPLNENPLRSAQGLRFNVIGGPSVIPREQRREARLVRLDLSETESEL